MWWGKQSCDSAAITGQTALHLMATVSSTIGEVSVFGEGVVTVDREAGSEEARYRGSGRWGPV